MATINSRQIIDQIISGNGFYKDDPRVIKIVKYTSKWGGTAYGVIYKGEALDRYHDSEYVINPVTIFDLSPGPEVHC